MAEKLQKMCEDQRFGDWAVKVQHNYYGEGHGENKYFVDIPKLGLIGISTGIDDKDRKAAESIVAACNWLPHLLTLVTNNLELESNGEQA
jgi:hypothetical protein